jgi:hypothetical protein
MTLASNAKTMDLVGATLVRRTVLRIAPLGVDRRFEELLPDGGKVRLGEIDATWGESYAVSNAVADIASLWGRVGAADPGRYGQALKQARAAAEISGSGAFLQVETRTPVQSQVFNYHGVGGTEDVGVVIDDPLSQIGREAHDQGVSSALGNLMIALPAPWSVSTQQLYRWTYLDAGGVQIYFLGVAIGQPALRTAGKFVYESAIKYRKLLARSDPDIRAALAMLKASAIDATNELEQFLFVWTALEFLVKDISGKHKAAFDKLAAQSGAQNSIDLLSTVLAHRRFDKKRSNLTFKFLVSAYVLDSGSVIGLFERFDPLRQFRNAAFHQASTANLEAHTERTRKLLLDLLRLHTGV